MFSLNQSESFPMLPAAGSLSFCCGTSYSMSRPADNKRAGRTGLPETCSSRIVSKGFPYFIMSSRRMASIFLLCPAGFAGS